MTVVRAPATRAGTGAEVGARPREGLGRGRRAGDQQAGPRNRRRTLSRGCLDGGGVPVAVVASGPDVVYPRRRRSLHERVRAEGLVLSELPPRAPSRIGGVSLRENRIMAGLARVTLVVEAADPARQPHHRGVRRQGPRAVLRGSGARVGSRPASPGADDILKDGATPISGTEDVLGGPVRRRGAACPGRQPPRARRSGTSAALAAAEAGDSVEAVAAAIGLPISRTRAALGRLEVDGYLVRRDLGGWERTAR